MLKKAIIGVSAASVLVVGVVVLTAASATANSAARTAPTCGAMVLRPAAGASQGAAGTLQDTWKLTNVGPVTCRMRGYAKVINYRHDGRPLPMSITHMGTPHVVTLAPGQHARFNLRYPNPGIRGCTAQNPAHMTIQTPGANSPVIATGGLHSCAGEASESPLVHG